MYLNLLQTVIDEHSHWLLNRCINGPIQCFSCYDWMAVDATRQTTVSNCKHPTLALTDCVVPAVDSEQPATCDSDGCWYAEVGERVGRDVSDGRVGGELEHHDDVLLHLILKHQRTLGKETLVRQTEKERRTERKRKGQGKIGGRGVGMEMWEDRETEQMGQRGKGKGRLVEE